MLLLQLFKSYICKEEQYFFCSSSSIDDRIIRMLMLREFKTWLSKSGLAENTIGSYLWTVRHFIDEYGGFTVDNLLKIQNNSSLIL